MPKFARSIALSLLLAACGSNAAVTTAPTTGAALDTLKILAPPDGTVVAIAQLTVYGTAPIGAHITRDISLGADDHTTADSSGNWNMTVSLKDGINTLTFRIADDETTAQTVHVTFRPAASITPTTQPTVAPTVLPTPTARPTPTPKPAPTPAPITYAKLTSRQWALLVKNPDAYTGKNYEVWACIFQFDAATGPDDFLANASYTKQTYWSLYGDNAAFGDLGYPVLDNFVENDIVFMHVTVIGSYSYDTQAGGNTTVPSFLIDAISRKGSC